MTPAGMRPENPNDSPPDASGRPESTTMSHTSTTVMPTAANSTEATLDDSPFGGGSTSRRRSLARFAIYGVVVILALVGTYLVTRDPEPAGDPGDHAHGAAPATGDSAAPVMLSDIDAQRIGVTFATATMGPIAQEIRTVGQITVDETRVSTIAPKVDGFVEELHVSSMGQSVRRGEPLLSVYSPMLVTAQEELLLARRLVSDVAGGTPDAIRGAQELLTSARRRLLYWDVPESEIERIERTGEVRRAITLTSPASGFVVEKAVFPGQRIMAGDALFKLADLSMVWVEGQVFEQNLADVRTGQTVDVTVDAYPSEQWVGRVAYVYPTLDSETRTTRVRVELANSGLRLKPGMYATLHISGVGRGNVVTVPRSAVLSTGQRNLVFVRRPDGMLEPREVAIGQTSDDQVEIRQGVANGETVVASATFLIDAESNLGSVVGGMANMPGMDMPGTDMPGMKADQPARAPTAAPPPGPSSRAGAPPPSDPASRDPHAAHRR